VGERFYAENNAAAGRASALSLCYSLRVIDLLFRRLGLPTSLCNENLVVIDPDIYMYMRNANAFLQGSSSLYVESDSSGPYKEEGSLINSTRFSRGQASVSTPTPESHTAMRNNTLSDEVGASAHIGETPSSKRTAHSSKMKNNGSRGSV
jgi:hypothetical protein